MGGGGETKSKEMDQLPYSLFIHCTGLFPQGHTLLSIKQSWHNSYCTTDLVYRHSVHNDLRLLDTPIKVMSALYVQTL